VDPEFASVFKFPKSKGGGFFTIKYLDAGFNKEAEMGEFFIEFFEKVKEHKLAQALERAGAGQVTITTFANNDGNESASNALLRVWTVQKQTGYSYRSGDCQEALLTKTQARFAESQKKQQETSEFDEKIKEAINRSLALQEDTNAKVAAVGGDVELIKDGVCAVIPDYQRKIEELERIVAHKTKECDRIEYAKAQKTRQVNELMAAMELVRDEKNNTQAQLTSAKLKLAKARLELESKKDMWTRIIKIDNMLSDFVLEERTVKRARAD